MRVLSRTLVALAAFLLIPSLASALGISIVNVSGAGASGVLFPGETVTFDLLAENNTELALIGVESEITGYDIPDTIQEPAGLRQYGLELQSGQAVDAIFGTFGPFGYSGLPNGPADFPLESQSGFDAWRTRLFAGGVPEGPGFSGTGADDPGIDGMLVGDGDLHFRVTFVANPTRIEPSVFTMTFGLEGLLADGSTIVVGDSDTFDLRVVPEPGTALLMGLGLAALGARRRA